MSCMLDLLLSLPPELSLMKYFWAWLATWVGVLVVTKFLDMFLQSPSHTSSSPSRTSCISTTSESNPRSISRGKIANWVIHLTCVPPPSREPPSSSPGQRAFHRSACRRRRRDERESAVGGGKGLRQEEKRLAG
ncbi:unnamed protein product [Spirodela intermedia]|uniref:Uncharacterized protein n=1 Tax=Spirodela intermedia TaxID=51605 RepID=A0A7I8IBJ4_SPIIN|nr:unnamed protein product [Spirodela intermedia]CAA6655105.1 unnamed protein product [Spirodela intermedia]